MSWMNTHLAFLRLNEEGQKQLQTAIDEGEEAFSRRFGFEVFWEDLNIETFFLGTRTHPPLKAITKMITWLATADKDVVARVEWHDARNFNDFGTVVYIAEYDSDDGVFKCEVDDEEHYFYFVYDCLPKIKRDYAKQIKEAGLKPDSDEDEDIEAFWTWIDESNADMDTITEVQRNATDADVKFFLSHTWQQVKDGWEYKKIRKKPTKKKATKKKATKKKATKKR